MREIQSILADARPARDWRAVAILGGLGLLFSTAIGYILYGLASENAALKRELAALRSTPSPEVQSAELQRLQNHSDSLRRQLTTLQQELTRRSEDTTRPITRTELFVLEEITRNAAWREGRLHDEALAHLLDELGVNNLAELTRGQLPDAIARAYQIRKRTRRRAYDPHPDNP